MKLLYFLFLALFFLGCNTSKKEDLEKIKQLEKEVLRQQELISKQKQIIQQIKKLEKSLEESQASTLQKDSILKAYQISKGIDATENANSVYNGVINYQPTSNDTYWQRGVYFSSTDSQEYLFNVRVSTYNDVFRVYFMGVKYPLKKGTLSVSIYELDEFKTINLIDTIDMSLTEDFVLGDNTPKWKPDDIKSSDYAFYEFVLLQSDNLILKEGDLYYYKPQKIEIDYSDHKLIGKEFYKYTLGTKEKSFKINDYVLSNIIVESPGSITNIHPNKSKFVRNFGEEMYFFKILDWNTEKQFIFTSNFKNIEEINFEVKKLIKFDEDGLFVDESTDKNLLFGGTTWHTSKNILYFDNSGITYRCIWQIDLDQKQVTKIVPEHEAIHPYFLKTTDKEYIIYTEKNKIMICEPPLK